MKSIIALSILFAAQAGSSPITEQERAKSRSVNEFGMHERPWAEDRLTAPAAEGQPIDVRLDEGLEQSARRTEGSLDRAGSYPAAMRRTVAEMALSLRAVQEERIALDRRSADVEERAVEVRVLHKLALEDINRLQTLKGEIEGLIEELETRESANVSYVASLLENMSEKDGARLLAENDDAFIIDVLATLDERQAAELLARMEDDRAADIIVRLGERGRPGLDRQPEG